MYIYIYIHICIYIYMSYNDPPAAQDTSARHPPTHTRGRTRGAAAVTSGYRRLQRLTSLCAWYVGEQHQAAPPPSSGFARMMQGYIYTYIYIDI